MHARCKVQEDQINFQKELSNRDLSYHRLQNKLEYKVIMDIAFDWIVIFLSMYCVSKIGPYAIPFAILAIGNRQRAMGNLLHDGGHRNLFNRSKMNDLVSEIFLAPALFNSLKVYRKLHARHHTLLGKPLQDPDYIVSIANGKSRWWATYRKNIFSLAVWRSSIMGHIGKPSTTSRQTMYIFSWWLLVLSGVALMTSAKFSLGFFLLWLASKATVFHLITTFREMCDHFGREPGGILSFTRDISTSSPLRWLFHPRNNGYHLTHHLLPMVPYYKLPQAHSLLITLPVYWTKNAPCKSYFSGESAVIHIDR